MQKGEISKWYNEAAYGIVNFGRIQFGAAGCSASFCSNVTLLSSPESRGVKVCPAQTLAPPPEFREGGGHHSDAMF